MINPLSVGNWDGDFLEFLLCHLNVMNRKASTLRAKVEAVRFLHIVSGEMDFAAGGNRIRTLLKGVGKRKVPNAKRPFSIELFG